ncbi:hypothetical protein DZ860_01360 [Vibrio sinensis]|uniref:Uncharacterized protein n=2 Tax=Vibrio sinensis TaxID=2302434 RepID=A0A3A6QVN7_9VIBR|nr:hypothetical protein DZ860_01360 [Vibrio sinensis]
MRLYPDLLVFIPTLTNEQLTDLLNTVRQRHIDYKKIIQSLDAEQKRERFQQKVEQQLELWFGELTLEQERLIVQWSQDSSFPYELWIEFQTQIRIELKQMFATIKDRNQFDVELQRLLFESETYYPPELAGQLQRNNQTQIEYVIKLAHSLTPRQIDYFHEELRYWRDLIDDIG